ncbi:phage distal tail protein [uncultured Clostridium sp.]|uniref:phage distal tail protein n=2 Tax=uncultured Clostridium sp. TaxID=59620 RepID=UPI00261CA523|nr:phage tail domain-containing protein [uncultured Clostridium sp.]
MKINGVNINSYGATRLGVDLQNYKYKTEYVLLPGSLTLVEVSTTEELKSIKVDLLFKGNNRDEILDNISRFMLLLKGELIISLSGYSTLFKVYLDNDSIEKKRNKRRCKLSLEFKGYALKNEVVEVLNRISSKVINMTGTQITPVIVEVTPTTDLVDIRLEGLADDPIIIKNLTANKKIIIDGELQKVTVDGKNKFKDTDMWEFPRLNPGKNTIKVSRSNCDISIKYKPRYI